MTALRLPRGLLPVLLLLADDPSPSEGLAPDLARRLDAAGVLDDGSVASPVRPLLAAISSAETLIGVDTVTAHRTSTTTIWCGPTAAAWARHGAGSGAVELGSVESVEVPLLLLQVTGFGTRPDPPGAGSVTMSPVDLESIRDWSAIDPSAARRIATAAVGEGEDPRPFVAALAGLRAEWRVTTSWVDDTGAPHAAALEVIDGGVGGYWRVDRAGGETVTLVPRSAAEVNRMLHAAHPDHRRRMAG